MKSPWNQVGPAGSTAAATYWEAQLTAVHLGSGACVADVALGVDSWMRKVPGWDGSGFIIINNYYKWVYI